MASTTFTDGTTFIYSSWLNDVNTATYGGTAGYFWQASGGSGRGNWVTQSAILTVGTLTYPDTNVLQSWQSSVNTYTQVIIQNSDTGNTASADVIVSNDQGTATAYYGDFGINSSIFAGSGSLNLPNATYLTSTSGDLVLGTTSNNGIHFVIDGATADAMAISNAGAITFPAGNLTIPSGATATTKTPLNNSTAVATTAYVDAAVAVPPILTHGSTFLGANVTLNNSTYTDGPSVNVGTSGTWFVTATVTCTYTTPAGFDVKLWDGTTLIASASSYSAAPNFAIAITLSGIITNPAANLRASVINLTANGGTINYNLTTNGKDSGVVAVRIG